MSGIHYGYDLFDEFARVQRQVASLFGEHPAGIRAVRPNAFPALNVGATDDAIEIVAFAPGMAPLSTLAQCSPTVRSWK